MKNLERQLLESSKKSSNAEDQVSRLGESLREINAKFSTSQCEVEKLQNNVSHLVFHVLLNSVDANKSVGLINKRSGQHSLAHTN